MSRTARQGFPQHDRGITLLQCLMGLAVLSTLSIVIMDLLGRSTEITHLSWETDMATSLAEAQLELVRAVDARSLLRGEGQPFLIGEEALDRLPFGDGRLDVSDETEGLRRVRAQVSWGPQTRRRKVVLETLVALPPEER
jgi:hypothetical protein